MQELMQEREKLRGKGKFAEADRIRKKIEAQGFAVVDYKDRSKIEEITEDKFKKANKSLLLIFGSGEISPVGRKIHEAAFQQIGKKRIKISIITTPAGFQPNVKIVHKQIKQFFLHSLQNFKPRVEIIYANNRKEANEIRVVQELENTDYIFLGPGSPTYAVANLKNTLLYAKIRDCLLQGASLALSSAAAIAFSRYALPVYEIYKAGAELYWEKGLNFYANFYKPLTVIPHFNNNEGGRKLDTSHCYVGKARFAKLAKLLPQNETLWGIDELTAAIVDLKTKKVTIEGKGQVHLINQPLANLSL